MLMVEDDIANNMHDGLFFASQLAQRLEQLKMLILNLPESFLSVTHLKRFNQVSSGLLGKINPKLDRKEGRNKEVIHIEGIFFGFLQLDCYIDFLSWPQQLKPIPKSNHNILHYYYLVWRIMVWSFEVKLFKKAHWQFDKHLKSLNRVTLPKVFEHFAPNTKHSFKVKLNQKRNELDPR